MAAEEVLPQLQCLLGFSVFMCLMFQSQRLVDVTLPFVIKSLTWARLGRTTERSVTPQFSNQRYMKSTWPLSYTEIAWERRGSRIRRQCLSITRGSVRSRPKKNAKGKQRKKDRTLQTKQARSTQGR